MSKKKKQKTYGEEKYTERELAQLSRRRMIQRDHGDKNKYSRKSKHKGLEDFEEDDMWHPDSRL